MCMHSNMVSCTHLAVACVGVVYEDACLPNVLRHHHLLVATFCDGVPGVWVCAAACVSERRRTSLPAAVCARLQVAARLGGRLCSQPRTAGCAVSRPGAGCAVTPS